MKTIYLDNNATTMVSPEVVDAMNPFFNDLWGNPSSMHSFGGQVRSYVEEARAKVASLIGADPEEIIFTSCGSESDNMAIRGILESAGKPRHIITTVVEHPAVLSICSYLSSQGHRLSKLECDTQGHFDLNQFRECIANDTALVSVMWANNETGVVSPIEDMAQIAKEAGVMFHTDAVQAIGKISINVKQTPVDLLSLSGHKFHAPKGIGALYIKKGTKINPLIYGGHQESGMRAGTENVPYIVGLGCACERAAQSIENDTQRITALRDHLEAGILKACSHVRVNGDPKHRLPNTLNISFEHINANEIVHKLNDRGIAVSAGAACTAGSLKISHVMNAMGVPFPMARGTIRLSLSTYTTREEIDCVLEHLPRIINQLRDQNRKKF
ncbi:MAG: cysteine desulfurase NifS [bacterium]